MEFRDGGDNCMVVNYLIRLKYLFPLITVYKLTRQTMFAYLIPERNWTVRRQEFCLFICFLHELGGKMLC